MSMKIVKPLTAAFGIALLGGAAAAQAGNLFALTDLDQGYQLVADDEQDEEETDEEQEDEEGSCGEGKCGEGKCGAA